MMTQHFVPDKYQTQDKRSLTSEKSTQRPLPADKPKKLHIICPFNTFATPGPKSKIWCYVVIPSTKIDLDLFSLKLNEYFPCKVTVRSVMFNLFNSFDVILDDMVTWNVIHDCTLKALEALEDSS